MLAARAAVQTAVYEAESGTLSGVAAKVTDSAASNASAVQFGPGGATAENEFSIAVIGDTQQEVIYGPAIAQYLVPNTTVYMNQYFNQRLQYLVSHKTEYNLKYVIQVGDLQNWDDDMHTQYIRASNGLKIIENAGIPWMAANGNHDNFATGAGGGARDSTQTKEYVRKVDAWNSYYPKSRFPGIQTICDDFPQYNTRLMAAFPAGMATTDVNHPQRVKDECAAANSTVNAFRTFDAGGLHWLIMKYEFIPRQVVQEWMKTVLERYPNYNVILDTHYNIDYGGGRSTGTEYGSPQGSPQAVYDNVIKRYANIKFVMSGHVSQNAFCSVSTGVNGNIIHNYLNDRLSGQDEPNYFRLVKFNISAHTITSQHIMPNTAPVQQAKLPGNPAECNETNVTWVR